MVSPATREARTAVLLALISALLFAGMVYKFHGDVDAPWASLDLSKLGCTAAHC